MAMEEEEEEAASKRGGRRQERQPAVEPAKKAEQVRCWLGAVGAVGMSLPYHGCCCGWLGQQRRVGWVRGVG